MIKGFFSKFFRTSTAEPLTLKTAHTATEHERRLVELCSMPVQEALAELFSDPRGLTAEAAEQRLRKFGPNVLAHTKELGFLADIFERCKSPLVIQLLLIAAISAFIGEIKSTVVVGLMVVLSVGLSYILDRRSTDTVEALGRRVQSRTRRHADGKEQEIDLSDIVPGDIVLLNAGSIIPADLRLLVAKDFFVSQSALTGESMAVEKTADMREDTRPERMGAAECLLSRKQRDQRHGPRRGHTYRNAYALRVHCRAPGGTPRGNQLRQGRALLHLAHDPVHGGHGHGRVLHRGPDQGRLGGGPPVRPFHRRGAHPGNAPHDRDREPREGRPDHGRRRRSWSSGSRPSRTSAP